MMSDKDNALAEGTYLRERYVIKRILGRGGFGFTYEAYDEANGKKCAIKEYYPRDAAMRLPDGRTLYQMTDELEKTYRHGMDRFMEEAQVLWKLQGVQSVVAVYDYFNENNTSYFVMEFIDGVTLKKLVKDNGKLDYNIVRSIFFDIGTGLIQVHSMGVFHRDIKPDNIMLTSEGRAKLIDFGNAKSIKRDADEGYSIMLTPKFAPPEQYQKNSEQGTFTDVYAFASTMFYAMTGTYMPEPTARYASGEHVNLEEVGFPKFVSDAMNKALKLNYKERTQTIYELLMDLRWFTDGGDTIYKEDNETQTAENNTTAEHAGVKQRQQEVEQSHSSNQNGWKDAYLDDRALDADSHWNNGDHREQGYQDKHYDGNGADFQYEQRRQFGPGRIPHPYIVIVSGDNAGTTVDIPVDRGVIVGRTKNYAQIIFEQDEFISKKHCEVYYDSIEDALYITDYSTNGTWVNGYKLNRNQVYAVEKGSMVVLANQKCSFKVGVTYQ